MRLVFSHTLCGESRLDYWGLMLEGFIILSETPEILAWSGQANMLAGTVMCVCVCVSLKDKQSKNWT